MTKLWGWLRKLGYTKLYDKDPTFWHIPLRVFLKAEAKAAVGDDFSGTSEVGDIDWNEVDEVLQHNWCRTGWIYVGTGWIYVGQINVGQIDWNKTDNVSHIWN